MPDHPAIALTAGWQTYPDRFNWIRENGFALEYSPNPERLEQLPEHIAPFLGSNIPVRYHASFPEYEIGHQKDEIRERAMHIHRAALEAIQGHGQQVVTVHIGLKPEDNLNHEEALENLKRLVEYAARLDITVCLENLRRGPTSHPETIATWARESGAMITLDVGHALSSQRILDGEMIIQDFLGLISDRIEEVHIYERETDRHYPPEDMTVLGPVIDRLLNLECRWWTIELDNYAEALATRDLLLDYLNNRK